MKQQLLRADQIKGHMCAWQDCEATFEGEMPRGWVWLITYWAAKPQVGFFLTVPQKDMPRDGVLCPLHNANLERLLKDLGRQLISSPPAGNA
jgi:hypothetical protein